MVSLFGRGKRDIVIEQEEKARIDQAVAEERKKQALLKFERRKAKAVARIRRPPIAKIGRRLRKGAKIAGKDLGKSLIGFARKVGKPSEAEKETVIIIGGKPKRVKGRVRIVRAQPEPFGEGLGVGMDEGLGLNVDLLGSQPKRRKQKGIKPFRFF